MSASPLQAVRAATTCSRVNPIAVRFETALSLTAAPAVAEYVYELYQLGGKFCHKNDMTMKDLHVSCGT